MYQSLAWYILAETTITMYILADFKNAYSIKSKSDLVEILILPFTALTINVSPFRLFFRRIFEIGSSIIFCIARRKNLTP